MRPWDDAAQAKNPKQKAFIWPLQDDVLVQKKILAKFFLPMASVSIVRRVCNWQTICQMKTGFGRHAIASRTFQQAGKKMAND